MNHCIIKTPQNSKRCLELLREKSLTRLLIADVKLPPKHFSEFLTQVRKLTCLALCSQEMYKNAFREFSFTDGNPGLRRKARIFLDRGTYSNYTEALDAFITARKIKTCFFVDNYWSAYSRPERNKIEAAHRGLDVYHVQLKSEDGSYLK